PSGFFRTEDDGVVLVHEPAQVGPQLPVRGGNVDMAAPDPRIALPVMDDERQRLRVVHDNHVMLEMITEGILEDDIFVNAPFEIGKLKWLSLKRVVHPLGDTEEI